MFKFKLNVGSHREGDKTYKAGDEINTTSDLRQFNTKGSQPRFTLMSETVRKPKPDKPEVSSEPEGDNEPEKPLREMHYKQLVKKAKEEGIDTTPLQTSEEVIAALEGE